MLRRLMLLFFPGREKGANESCESRRSFWAYDPDDGLDDLEWGEELRRERADERFREFMKDVP